MVKGEFFNVEQVSVNKVPHLRFFGRYADKSKLDFTVKGPKPYFYILHEEEHLIDFPCDKDYFCKSVYGDSLIRILVENPWDIKEYVKKFSKTFEADIPFPTRYLIDKDIYTSVEVDTNIIKKADSCEVEPRVMLLDIETEYYGGSNYEMNQPIISISFYDNYNDKFYTIAYNNEKISSKRVFNFKSEVCKRDFTCEETIVGSEVELLGLFKRYVLEMDIDIFSGWNTNFDMIYILRRLEFHGLSPEQLSPILKYYYATEYINSGAFKAAVYKKREKKVMIRGRAILDLLRGYKRLKWKQVQSFALDAIGQDEFKIGKIEYDGWMGDFWKQDFNKFLDYNRRDIEICIAINNQYSITDFLLNLRRITGAELSDVHFNSRLIDVYILRKCRNRYILPSKVFKDNMIREKIEGGFVLEPKVGLFKNIVALDMKSLYPSIMLSLNMSPETISDAGSIKVPNGVRFSEKTGVLTEVLKDLISRRDEIRKKLKTPEINSNPSEYLRLYKYQYAYKTFSNSLYGVTLFPSFRLFDPRIGASITYTGRFIVKRVQEYCEQKGYKVIRMDTDSTFVDFNEDNLEKVIEKGKQLEKEINTMYDIWFNGWNNDTSYFSIKAEKIYGVLYSGEEKKLYGGNIVWDWEKGVLKEPDIEIKGFAAKRSDRSLFSRNLQKHVFELVFKNSSREDILNFILEEVNKFLNNKYDFETIGIPKAITKDRNEYKVENPWLRGITWSEKHIVGFQFTPKPFLLYIQPTANYNTDVICFTSSKQVPRDIKINYQKMCESSIYNILKKILPIIKMDEQTLNIYLKNKINKQVTLF